MTPTALGTCDICKSPNAEVVQTREGLVCEGCEKGEQVVNVFDEITNGRYENKVSFTAIKEAIDPDNMTGKQVREIKERNEGARKTQINLYYAEASRLRCLFKADLEAMHGVRSNPKADKLFAIAWERDHSSGYSDIAHTYSQLVELILP